MPPILHSRTLRLAGGIAALLGFALATPLVAAQSAGGRIVTIVVPFPAGAGPDLAARTIAEKLALRIGQPVIVDNKPGVGGLSGATFVARAPADGSSLLLAPNTLVISPHVLPKGAGGGLDVLKDLAPIVTVATTPMLLVANPQAGIRNTEQRDRALRPLRQGVALVQRGFQHFVAGVEQGPRVRMEIGIEAAQFLDAARRRP